MTNSAWLDMPGTKVPASTACWVLETNKLHHHSKVSAQSDYKYEFGDILKNGQTY